MMPLGMLLRHLIVLRQTVVQLKVADELQPWEEVRVVEVGGLELALEHFHDDDSLLLPESFDLLD